MDKPDNSVENNKDSSSAAQAGDWVKHLFAPIFDFDSIVDASKNGLGTDTPRIKRAPILDPVTVKEVFDRVHQRVVEAERIKQEEAKEKLQEAHDKKIDPRKSSIWNTEELDTLRKVYKSAKGEISYLEVALRDSRAHNKRLESELANERNESDSLRDRLSEVTKSNQRLVIHRDSLQKEAAVLEVKVAALTDMWHEIERLKLQAMEEAKQARHDFNSERLTRQKLEADLSEHRLNAQREKELSERDIETKYEIEMNDLRDVIKDLTVQLSQEQKEHAASKRGLEHLRLHFSSLPMREVLPANIVMEDQVKDVDHLGL